MSDTSRRVLVTGASGGIGGATAEAFAENGDLVIATARSEDRLAALAAKHPGKIETIAGDLTDEAFAEALAARAEPVDILVNCAGWARHTPIVDGDPADWERAWRINVHAVFVLTRLVARSMKARQSGQIVNISSVLADRVYPFGVVYAATKHAIRAFSRGLRMELAKDNVKVIEVAPGLVESGFLDDVDHPEVLAAYAARGYPPIQPGDIAGPLVAATMTGPNVVPDLIVINPMGQVN